MTLLVDIILLVALISIIASSYQAGLIKTFGGLIGLIVGIIVAGKYFERLAEFMMPVFQESENLAKIISFLVIFVAINGAIALIVLVLDSTFDFISFIPFLKTINRAGGAALGFLVGVFILGIMIVMIDKFPFADFVQPYLEESRIVPMLVKVTKIILPLLPEVIREVKGVLKI